MTTGEIQIACFPRERPGIRTDFAHSGPLGLDTFHQMYFPWLQNESKPGCHYAQQIPEASGDTKCFTPLSFVSTG